MIITVGSFTFDLENKVIDYISGTPAMKCAEIYEMVCERWDEPDMMMHQMPMACCCICHIQITNGWRASYAAMVHILADHHPRSVITEDE